MGGKGKKNNTLKMFLMTVDAKSEHPPPQKKTQKWSSNIWKMPNIVNHDGNGNVQWYNTSYLFEWPLLKKLKDKYWQEFGKKGESLSN